MNLNNIVNLLQKEQVIAYPTESVFGLGCDPNSKKAVKKLLWLKKRSIEKGLILIAPDIKFLLPFIDQIELGAKYLQKITHKQSIPTTWLVPKNNHVPIFLTGRFDTVAIRITDHVAIKLLCEKFGHAITSTSANLNGLLPCKTAVEVQEQFGKDFPILDGEIGGAINPSEIRDIFTDCVIRKG